MDLQGKVKADCVTCFLTYNFSLVRRPYIVIKETTTYRQCWIGNCLSSRPVYWQKIAKIVTSSFLFYSFFGLIFALSLITFYLTLRIADLEWFSQICFTWTCKSQCISYDINAVMPEIFRAIHDMFLCLCQVEGYQSPYVRQTLKTHEVSVLFRQ